MQHDYMDHNYNLFDENHYPNIESRGNGSNQLDKFPSSTEEDSYITVLEENDVEWCMDVHLLNVANVLLWFLSFFLSLFFDQVVTSCLPKVRVKFILNTSAK